MGGTPTLVGVLASLNAALLALVVWGVRRLARGQWVPETVHLRELEQLRTLADGWRTAYHDLFSAHDLTLKQMDAQRHGLEVTTKVVESLPLPPEPPAAAAHDASLAT